MSSFLKKSFEEILSDVIFLFRGYSQVFRANTQPYRLEILRTHDSHYEYRPEDALVRESLLEHVGMLPILATYFHPLVEEPVNLGKVLEMLAIHDIGEIVFGDENVFTKKDAKEEAEVEEGFRILHANSHGVYREFKEGTTNEAKFAKSVDKIAPDILDLICESEVTRKRLKHFAHIEPGDIVSRIERSKSPSMQWSSFFRAFHAELMVRLRERLRG